MSTPYKVFKRIISDLDTDTRLVGFSFFRSPEHESFDRLVKVFYDSGEAQCDGLTYFNSVEQLAEQLTDFHDAMTDVRDVAAANTPPKLRTVRKIQSTVVQYEPLSPYEFLNLTNFLTPKQIKT